MIKAAAIAVAFLGVLGLHGGAADAHTEVQRAEPGPADEVTGTVDTVSLSFVEPIRPGAAIVVVDHASAAPVEGLNDAVLSDDARTLTVTFDPLGATGTYRVTYEYAAIDGHPGGDSYTFRYTSSDGGGAGILQVAIAVAVGALIVALFVLALRRRTSGEPENPMNH